MRTLTLKFLMNSLGIKELTHDNIIDVHNFVGKEKSKAERKNKDVKHKDILRYRNNRD